jgi:hypothetical protein
LFSLSQNVFFNVLSNLGKDGKYIRYRDSVLTKLLSRSLSNAETLMFATLSPCDWNYEESLNTLRNAFRVMKINGGSIVNQSAPQKNLVEKFEIKSIKEIIEDRKIVNENEMITRNPNKEIMGINENSNGQSKKFKITMKVKIINSSADKFKDEDKSHQLAQNLKEEQKLLDDLQDSLNLKLIWRVNAK